MVDLIAIVDLGFRLKTLMQGHQLWGIHGQLTLLDEGFSEFSYGVDLGDDLWLKLRAARSGSINFRLQWNESFSDLCRLLSPSNVGHWLSRSWPESPLCILSLSCHNISHCRHRSSRFLGRETSLLVFRVRLGQQGFFVIIWNYNIDWLVCWLSLVLFQFNVRIRILNISKSLTTIRFPQVRL